MNTFPFITYSHWLGNEAALGFDLASNPARLQALSTSRDSASPQASASTTLVQGGKNQKGFLAFVPVFSGLPATVEKRRKNLKGFVLGVYGISDILR